MRSLIKRPWHMRLTLAAMLGVVCTWPAAMSLGARQDTVSEQTPRQSPPDSYRLQPGDEISIRVRDLKDLDETVRIRPDGRISLLLLDDLLAAGLTPQELDAAITTGYANFYRNPEVTVIVRNFANLRVFIAGEVTQPGPQPIIGRLTALSAVVQAGGFRPTARPESVVLLRNDGTNRPRVTQLDMKAIVEKGEPDVPLEPFDVIYVPMSRIARIDRFVDQYMRQLIPISVYMGFSYLVNERIVPLP